MSDQTSDGLGEGLYSLGRPDHIGDAHWESISTELLRLNRSTDAEDRVQVLGDLKCLLESIAKVVLDVNGTPADGNSKFPDVLGQAHKLLAKQRGRELSDATDAGNIATQARKIAVSMASIRNGFGGGHGRARQPVLHDELHELAVDGSLMWARWALRRLGHFAKDRPETLIRDLVGDPDGAATFYRGLLAQRLRDADLENLDPKHARAIGVAVGQRAARQTFVVYDDGVQACINGDLRTWPADYRIGVATGLLFAPDERPTTTLSNVQDAALACRPVVDRSEDLATLLERVTEQIPAVVYETSVRRDEVTQLLGSIADEHEAAERESWLQLRRRLASASVQGS